MPPLAKFPVVTNDFFTRAGLKMTQPLRIDYYSQGSQVPFALPPSQVSSSEIPLGKVHLLPQISMALYSYWTSFLSRKSF